MKTRDAERSREAILEAAEQLFSRKGFDGCSLSDIGGASGLSRATPNYFFGSKENLYREVLQRVFAARQHETELAVAGVLSWGDSEGADPAELEAAMSSGMERYMRFLLDRPGFGRLIFWEELDGGRRLAETERDSTAVTEAFEAVRSSRRRQGLSTFDVGEAVLLWTSLGFLPASLPGTFAASQGMDLGNPVTLRRHADLCAAQLMALIER